MSLPADAPANAERFGDPALITLTGNNARARLPADARLACPRTCTLAGNNPAGSVKDRPALFMINEAEREGRIKPGQTLIEATSGVCTDRHAGARVPEGVRGGGNASGCVARRAFVSPAAHARAHQAILESRWPWLLPSKATR